jgi:hypothetical protein
MNDLRIDWMFPVSCPQDYLLRIGYGIVTRQFSHARTVDGGRWW